MNPSFRKYSLLLFFTLASLGFHSSLKAQKISTLAGNGEQGYSGDNSAATQAKLNQTFGVIVGPDGDIYFCDTGNHSIRKVSRKTGKITTIAGTGKSGYSGDGGAPTEAQLFEPYELRFHPSGDLYWVEMKNHLIRRIDARQHTIHTVAGTGIKGFSGDGGPAIKAKFNRPHSIQFDQEGENLYICDIGNHRIRRINLEEQSISTWCGNGKKENTPDGAAIGPNTPLNGPRALDIDPQGNLWLALREGNRIYKLDMNSHTLKHIAGTGENGFTGNGGPALEAKLSGPKGIAVSPDGKRIYLADTESHSIRAIDLSKTPPTLELIAGDGKKGDGPDSGEPNSCQMDRPHGLGVDPLNGDLYIGDTNTHKIRVIKGFPVDQTGGKALLPSLASYAKDQFQFEGKKCVVSKPKKAAAGRPWIWRCRFYGAFPQVDAALLAAGWHVVFIDVANLFGAAEAMRLFDAFYPHVISQYQLAEKPIMEGFSRGGLPAMNWSIQNPQKVRGIYLDAPVLDIHTWPKEYSKENWEKCKKVWGLTEGNAHLWKGPLDHLAPLAKHQVPILTVCGGMDKAVPFLRNSAILESHYQKLGGPIQVIVKTSCRHHPHSLYDPTPILDWINTTPAAKK
ncbi:MAG: SMP-30/gluconolactonase/LRE family protein [Verrucomicrobiales bacterium]|nr:SMP-30/gluconolactonase/LRE family protein [Verrucomicrobiales bacterium]